MKLDIDSRQLDIPCPHCNHKIKESIGRLKRNPNLSCTSCRQSFSVDPTGLNNGIQAVERELAEFKRKLGKMFK